MIDQKPKTKAKSEQVIPYRFKNDQEREDYQLVIKDVVKGRTVIQKSYNQFNGRTLYDVIDDWSKRWNGYLPATSILTQDRSNIFLNFTRNMVVSFLSKVALGLPDIKTVAVNKTSGMQNKKFAELLHDLNDYSNNAENAQSKFLESALECAVKGTVIKYEGFLKNEQEMEVAEEFDEKTGELKTKKEKRVLFDDCYQELVAIEDFYIANPYQPDVQKQPFVIWKKITTYEEAEFELGHYPNFKYVKAGSYTITNEPTTFYRNSIYTDLQGGQVEVLRYYNKHKNKHIILVNGVPVFQGIIPFKDGNYPFPKGIHEPYGNDFFWGMGLPQKIQGDQDLVNTLWNMMVDKTYGSLLPFGLSSDVDDLVDDTILEPNKIRKVGDINNWRFETLPGINSGEQSMLQSAIGFVKENSGVEGGASAASSKGGKVSMRQAMLKQQETMQKLGFNMSYLEDFELERTKLRIAHILQYYSIPKMEKISGKNGKEIQKLTYRELKITGAKLSDGQEGTKIVKMVDNSQVKGDNERKKLADEFSVIEEQGELNRTPTEVLAMNVDTFYDYNWSIQIVKGSSYTKNQLLDRAERMEYAQFRLANAQIAPVNTEELMKWVDESYEIDSDKFKPQQKPQELDPNAMAMMQGQPQGQVGKPTMGQMLTE